MTNQAIEKLYRERAILENVKELNNRNKVMISGTIEDEFKYSHTIKEINFYKTTVKVTRISGTPDYIPITTSNIEENVIGKYIKIYGELRTWTELGEDSRRHLKMAVYAKKMEIYENKTEESDINIICLNGYVCQEPVYRLTPFRTKITDLKIAVPRKYNKKDYVPCITWGEDAMYSSNLKIGARMNIYGRIQSREYLKRYSKDSEEGEIKTTYEVSVGIIYETK